MKKQIRFTVRDRLVFEHLKTFQISTRRVIKSVFFAGKKMAAVDSMQRRLDSRGAGYIYTRRLPNSRTRYLRLTEKGADYLGVKVDTQPICETRLFALMGRLHFINDPPAGCNRSLCTNESLGKFIASKDLEEGRIRPPRVDFYIAQSKLNDGDNPNVVLGAILPDLNSDVRRIIDRLVKHSRNIITRNQFISVMSAGRFEWTILTGHEAKKEELLLGANRMINRRLASEYFKKGLGLNDTPPIRVKVEVVPELANLRLRKRRKRGNE
jgi:hypothetical protein